MKTSFSRIVTFSLLSLCSVSFCQRPTPSVLTPQIVHKVETLSGTDYTAKIGLSGMLESLEVDGKQFLASPLLYGNQNWRSLKAFGWIVTKKETLSPKSIRYTLSTLEFEQGKKPVVEMTYEAKTDVLNVTLKRLSNAWGGQFGWRTSPTVLGVTIPETAPPGFRRLPGRGITYGLPYPGDRQQIRQMVYSLDEKDITRLAVEYRLGDAGYNRQGEGAINGNGWGREQIDDKPLEFSFRPILANSTDAKGKSASTASGKYAPAFALFCDKPGRMFRPDESISLKLTLNSAISDPLTLTYSFVGMGEKVTAFNGTSAPLKSGAGIQNKFDLKAPKRLGWYRLRVQLAPALGGNLTQDEIEIGVYRPTAALPTPEVKTNSETEITGLLGLKCQRLSLTFGDFFPLREKSPVGDPAYDWKRFDDQIQPFVTECKRMGVNGVALLNNRPAWCDETNFKSLLKAIVARHGDKQKAWEIENEPNDRYTPENYVKQALAPAYAGAHAARPDVAILGPGIVRADLNWFARFFKAGGANVCDAISTHTYTGHNRSWEEHGNVEQLQGIRKLMTEAGAKEKPLWITESGFTWDNHADMPRLHAQYCVRSFALAASAGIPIERYYYFYTRYAGFQPWYLYDEAPNYSGMAMRNYSTLISGKMFSREVDLGRHAHGITFAEKLASKKGKGEETTLLWTDDFISTAQLKIPVTSLFLRDLMGNPITAKREKMGVWSVVLSGSPIYLTVPKGTKIESLTRWGKGTNVALASAGSTPEASSSENPELAANLNDGTWHFDDGQSAQKIWIAKKGEKMPQWTSLTFDKPRTIGSIFVTSPSSNVGLPGVRDFEIQVMTASGWKTVREIKNNVLEWTLFARFKPLKTQAIRLLINDLNNGWWRTDKTPLTDMQARVYEMEAYAD